jgi:hypothetical protein
MLHASPVTTLFEYCLWERSVFKTNFEERVNFEDWYLQGKWAVEIETTFIQCHDKAWFHLSGHTHTHTHTHTHARAHALALSPSLCVCACMLGFVWWCLNFVGLLPSLLTPLPQTINFRWYMSHILTPFLPPVQLWENVCLFSPHCTTTHIASNWMLWFQRVLDDKLISQELWTCLPVLNLCVFYLWDNLSDTVYGNNSCTEVSLMESVHNVVFSAPVELVMNFLGYDVCLWAAGSHF